MPSFKGPEHRRSEIPFQGGPLSLEFHFEADHYPEFHFEVDHCLEVFYRRTTVWKKWTELFRSLKKADRGISKVQNSKRNEDGPHLTADQICVFSEVF
ncbi:hypothetical protein RclHR1_07680018 [Rhizophagus clarus]|uniref:Uncharacterized protein n=1 Tax=Rhizophagus clarus TaxID=94130 RepID=A0A2Z6RY33_9GLOM|nr:hypothetical protein RclHR1_07680018 [Rhizophagus clarus]